MTKRNAMTLLELVVVVVVLGILVGIAVPTYRKAIERAKDKEAQVALTAIWDAQRIYYMKYNNYAWAEGAVAINSALRLDLEEINWLYAAGDDPTIGMAQAINPLPGWDRTFYIDASGTIYCQGTCNY